MQVVHVAYMWKQSEHPDMSAVCSGAILSNYQRLRVENVYAVMASISYKLSFAMKVLATWRRLAGVLVAAGLNAALLCVL